MLSRRQNFDDDGNILTLAMAMGYGPTVRLTVHHTEYIRQCVPRRIYTIVLDSIYCTIQNTSTVPTVQSQS